MTGWLYARLYHTFLVFLTDSVDVLNFDMIVIMLKLSHFSGAVCVSGTHFVTTLHAKFLGSNPSEKPQENLEIWDMKTGQLVHAFLQKKQHDW